MRAGSLVCLWMGRARVFSYRLESTLCRASRAYTHQRLEMYEAGLLPWDIEMTVEEPVSDDDDGSPHRVSDSESESESEQDSD